MQCSYLDCDTTGGGAGGGGAPAGVEWATEARWGWILGGCHVLPPAGEVRPVTTVWGWDIWAGDDTAPNGLAFALNLWSDFAEWTVSVTTTVLVWSFL